MTEQDWFGGFPPSRPLEVENGLRARSSRGQIGEAWWSRRFITVLEEIGMGSRLDRGKNYARRGQVISFEVDAGMVSAAVQGTRGTPYRVRIGITPYDKRAWSRIEDGLAQDAWYAAMLLAGNMPDDIEDVFAAHDLKLFPGEYGDLSMDCSCPDGEVPCKHLAAVFYLLAEAFDEDPFLILAWRGREREELLGRLSAARSPGNTPAVDRAEGGGLPLEECLDTFFLPQPAPDALGVDRSAAPATSAHPDTAADGEVLDGLPDLEIRIRDHSLPELLRPAYAHFGNVPPS